MSAASEFRAALQRGDLAHLKRIWAAVAPDMPQPQTEAEMHYARSQATSVTFRARAYSHAWLCERSLPSGLPDELRPKAERIYPVAIEGVMISVNTNNAYLKPAAVEVRKAMEYAVNDIYADDAHPDPVLVRQQMQEARAREWRKLVG